MEEFLCKRAKSASRRINSEQLTLDEHNFFSELMSYEISNQRKLYKVKKRNLAKYVASPLYYINEVDEVDTNY